MEFGLTTPALLFPAISLLLLAYTNRFLALANVVRQLSETYRKQAEPEERRALKDQIEILKKRIQLIQRTQEAGTLSFLFCVVCMFVLYAGFSAAGELLFGVSIILLAISLALSIYEIHISVKALDIHLSNLQKKC